MIVRIDGTGLRSAFAGGHFGHRNLLGIHTSSHTTIYTLHEAHIESGKSHNFDHLREQKAAEGSITPAQAPYLVKVINEVKLAKGVLIRKQLGFEIEGSKSGAPENQETGYLMLTTMRDPIRYLSKGTKGSH